MEIAAAIPTLPQPRRLRDYSLNPSAYGVRVLRARPKRSDLRGGLKPLVRDHHLSYINRKPARQSGTNRTMKPEISNRFWLKFPGRVILMGPLNQTGTEFARHSITYRGLSHFETVSGAPRQGMGAWISWNRSNSSRRSGLSRRSRPASQVTNGPTPRVES